MSVCYHGETIIVVSLSRFKRRHIRWDAAASASSVPNTHGKIAKRTGLRSAIIMRTSVIQIAVILLIVGLCSSNASEKVVAGKMDDARKGEPVTVPPHLEDTDDVTANDSKEKDQSDELPILPPIILLDFGNDTENENVTSEEKSKRTVDGGLGYGLDRNVLQPKRYNYYLPAGKSGTTVSIEESVSPFLPKTIIERVRHGNQRQQIGIRQNSFASSFFEPNGQTQGQAELQHPNLQQQPTKSQSVFGLRTIPQKATGSSNFEAYQSYLTTQKPPVGSFAIQNSGYRNNDVSSTTQSPLAYSGTETVRYVTPNPVNFANPQSDSFDYAAAAPSSYSGQRQNIQSNINSHGFGSVPQSVGSSTVSPLNYNPRYSSVGSQFSNSPRYTVENGLRYENKVFWKYPDGRVSDDPPRTYVETSYSGYPQSLAQQPAKPQASHSIYESGSTENSVLSQGPVQFPTVSEPVGQEPNPFISGESLSSSLPQQQVYRLGYQNLVAQRQNLNLAQQRKPTSNVATSYSFSSSSSSLPFSSSSSSGRTRIGSGVSKINYDSRYQTTSSKYMVNSPNPEYTNSYTTESTVNSTTPLNHLFDSSAEHSSRAASKYNPKVLRNYLDTVISEDDESKKQRFTSNDLSSYANLQYSDLLNYNPSISEYIRNPSSILNVRPTFVQAGSSLVPVIILRVDGASPIETKATQNINLKALLQQYLIQYAKSIQELTQPSIYNLGTESFSRARVPGPNKSPVLDLIRLTQDDALQAPSYDSKSYIGRSSYETSNLEESKDFAGNRYSERSSGRPKVKNVQILEDPRYTAYKKIDN